MLYPGLISQSTNLYRTPPCPPEGLTCFGKMRGLIGVLYVVYQANVVFSQIVNAVWCIGIWTICEQQMPLSDIYLWEMPSNPWDLVSVISCPLEMTAWAQVPQRSWLWRCLSSLLVPGPAGYGKSLQEVCDFWESTSHFGEGHCSPNEKSWAKTGKTKPETFQIAFVWLQKSYKKRCYKICTLHWHREIKYICTPKQEVIETHFLPHKMAFSLRSSHLLAEIWAYIQFPYSPCLNPVGMTRSLPWTLLYKLRLVTELNNFSLPDPKLPEIECESFCMQNMCSSSELQPSLKHVFQWDSCMHNWVQGL